MEKRIVFLLALIVMTMPAWARGHKSKDALHFNAAGKFKIVQFRDIHFQYDSYRSDSAMVLMNKVIRKEKPDLLVLTGNVTGRHCYGEIGHGARVIELYENARKFNTGILKLYECDRDKDI